MIKAQKRDHSIFITILVVLITIFLLSVTAFIRSINEVLHEIEIHNISLNHGIVTIDGEEAFVIEPSVIPGTDNEQAYFDWTTTERESNLPILLTQSFLMLILVFINGISIYRVINAQTRMNIARRRLLDELQQHTKGKEENIYE